MSEVASLQCVPQLTLEEKLSALEIKFTALEKKYSEIYNKGFTGTEDSSGKSTEVGIAQRASSTIRTTDKEGPPEEKETGTKSRAKILINRADSKTGERKDYPHSDPSPAGSEPDTSYAFTLRKNLYEDAVDNSGEIDIINPDLWNLLRELLRHYPYHIFDGPPATLFSPYEPLILNWSKLEQAVGETPKDDNDKRARSDLSFLLNTVSSSSGDPKLDKYFKTRDANIEQKSVTFETLWTIFSPGSSVYGQPFQGQHQVFIVQDNTQSWPYVQPSQLADQSTWNLLCWTYDWDGDKFRRMCLRLDFEIFAGQKPITSLPYYPFELNEQRAEIQTQLIQQGKRYREICSAAPGRRMFEYNGHAIFINKGFSGAQADDNKDTDGMSDLRMAFWRSRFPLSRSNRSGPPNKSTKVESRTMVDFESYSRVGSSVAYVGSLSPADSPECKCIDCRENVALRASFRTNFDEEMCQKGGWEDEQYMLCPPRVLGYILREKYWAQLQVSVLRSIPEKDPDDSWSTRLKLADDEKTKDMIIGLVQGHGTSDPDQHDNLEVNDIVAKKGKGLVMLLYGPPGVGKTSTAETVAIATRKPLFAISVADVGTEAQRVEANLDKIFNLASAWQAILLIDEADVFLESRGEGLTSNTERNALVSVFLRVLEYYQGILMLTTNQIAQFDVAVQSRIHVAIKFVHLNKSQTMAIFEGFLNPLDRRGLIKDMEKIRRWLEEDVVKMGLDGPQIRNVVTSALGLARSQKKSRLDKSDLKVMLNNVKDFKDEFIAQFENYKSRQKGMIG